MERGAIIFVCFKLGFKQREIVAILQSQFGINVSERHLRRILCKLNLHRGEHSDIVDVATFVSSQLESSGQTTRIPINAFTVCVIRIICKHAQC